MPHDLQHQTWRRHEMWRINAHADAVMSELRRMSNAAMQSIEGRIAFYNRSDAQKRRWAAFYKFTRRKA